MTLIDNDVKQISAAFKQYTERTAETGRRTVKLGDGSYTGNIIDPDAQEAGSVFWHTLTVDSDNYPVILERGTAVLGPGLEVYYSNDSRYDGVDVIILKEPRRATDARDHYTVSRTEPTSAAQQFGLVPLATQALNAAGQPSLAQVSTLRATLNADLSVTVGDPREKFVYYAMGSLALAEFTVETITLAGYIAGLLSGYHGAAMVCLDTSTGTLKLLTMTAIPASADLPARTELTTLSFDFLSRPYYIPVVAVYCYDGQTEFEDADRLGGDPRTLFPPVKAYIALKDKYNGTAAPAVTDDTNQGYSVGSMWYDTTNDVSYACLDSTAGAAVWRRTSGVTSVTASNPLASSGGLTPNISLTGIVPLANGGTGANMSATGPGLIKQATAGSVFSTATAGTDYTTPTGTENLSNKTITASGIVATALSLLLGGFKAIFTHSNSADRTYTLPDYNGTLATLAGAETFTNKTLTTPTIGSFANANHDHTNSAGGGQLNASSVFSAGTVPVARLPLLVGDSGSGGTAGIVPAPSAGDAAANKYLKADGTWATAGGGTGDVVGPGSATDNAVARYDTTTGKLLQDSLLIVDDSGNAAATSYAVNGTAGAGYVELPDQSSFPSAPSSGVRLFVDSLIQFAWRSSVDGFVRRFGGTLTANKTYTLPDINGTVIVDQGSQTLFSKTLASPAIADFSNAIHSHNTSSGGGQLNASNVFASGTVPLARGGTGANLSATGPGLLKQASSGATVSIATAGTDYTTPTGTENLSNKTITASGIVATALSLLLGGFKAIFTHSNSADRTYTLPDYNGTLATLAGAETFTNKTLTAPTIASFTNATHSHQNAAGGGTLDGAAIGSGTVPVARLPLLVGDSGAGGTAGLVPAPSAGDAAANKYLKADGTWATAGGGTGDVVGPGSATDNAVARYDTTTGKLLQDSLLIVDDSGNAAATSYTANGTAGAGYAELVTQSSDPAAPSGGVRLFANSAAHLAWRSSVDTYVRRLIGSITASRNYTLPDYDGTLATLAGSETFTNKTLTTPTIGSFANANHDHTNSAGGGQLNASSVFSAGTVPVARLPLLVGDSGSGGTAGISPAPSSGDAAAGKFLKADGTWAVPSGGATPGSNTKVWTPAASSFAGTTFTDIDAINAKVTITVSGTLLIATATFYGGQQTAVTGYFTLILDSTTRGGDATVGLASYPNGVNGWVTIMWPFTVTAGSHDIKLQWRTASTGSVRLNGGNSGAPVTLTVYEVG